MQSPIVKIEHLSHKYNSSWAIRDINIEISQSGIVGLLGSNGAGKSTTMNTLCGALTKTEGKIYIGGIDMRKEPEAAKKLIGFLPQNPPLYMDLTVDEYLGYCADLRKMQKEQIRPALEDAKERYGIAHSTDRLIRNLSCGTRPSATVAPAISPPPRRDARDDPAKRITPTQSIRD